MRRAPKLGMSPLEESFALQLRALKVPPPVREHVFARPRRFRFDFAWPAHQIAVEIEGGIWSGGRHTRGAGFEGDLEKYNLATTMGWAVLRFSDSFIKSGAAVTMTAKLLNQRLAA